MIKVLLADDHKIFRDGIMAILSEDEEIEVIGEAGTGQEAIDVLCSSKTDLVLLDINMPELNGIEVSKYIKNKHPDTKILMLTMHDEDKYILKMLQIGVSGYLLKSTGKKELLTAIKTVVAGDSYYSSEVSTKIFAQFSKTKKNNSASKESPLTSREIEVLQLIVKGYTNSKIGEELFISPRTVDTHRRNTLQKLKLHNAVELTRYAHKHGLIT